MNADDIAGLLAFDPLAAAEAITGSSYEGDEGTAALGVAVAIAHGAEKDAALTATDDTTFSTKTDQYLRIATEEGFRVVLAEEFDGGQGRETFYVMWHDDGILLAFDTYWAGKTVNSGKFAYNFRPPADLDDMDWRALSSHGPLSGGVTYGDHDCREALRFNLARLRGNVELVKPWVTMPFVARNLAHHRDWNGPEDARERASAARLAALPADVRAGMGLDR